jgi:hypothetical protein
MSENVQGQEGQRQEITLKLPGANEPGFLRRMRDVQEIMDLSKKEFVVGTFAMWDAFGSYLVDRGYVECAPGVDPREAILELTQGDLSRALAAFAGIDMPKAVDPPTGAA